MEDNTKKKFETYFRIILVIWLLIVNFVLQLAEFPYGWLIFMSNIFMFTLSGDIKENFISVEIGGLVGLLCTLFMMIMVLMVGPLIGIVGTIMISLIILLPLLILAHPKAPLVLNNVGFAYLTCATIDTNAFAENIGLYFAVFIIGSLVVNGVSILLMKPAMSLAKRSAQQ